MVNGYRAWLVAVLAVVLGLYCCSGAMAFGAPTGFSLGDQVWYDANSSGTFDSGDQGIQGVTVTLTDSSGNLVDLSASAGKNPRPTYSQSTYPVQNGFYTFDFLPAGTYTVTLSGLQSATLDDGTLVSTLGTLVRSNVIPNATNSDQMSATIILTGSRDDVDFGFKPASGASDVYTISGTVWYDKLPYGDAPFTNLFEYGFAGVTVSLTDAAGKIVTATTDSNGFYYFSVSALGDYKVAVTAGDPLTGFTQTYDITAPLDNKATVSITKDAKVVTNVNFGYTDKAASSGKVTISGFVYNDSDADGVLDTGEPKLPGETITLKNSSGTTLKTTTAGADGSFSFTDLTPSTYKVVETNLANYNSTNALPGTGGSKYNKDTITVVATVAGSNYPNQNFLDTGSKPGVTLVKTGPATAKVGDTITYHFKVTNTGNTWLYGGVTVNDPMLGGNIWHQTPVAPGQVCEFDKTYKIPASVSGSYGNDGGCGSRGGYGYGCGLSEKCSGGGSYTPPTTGSNLVNTATATGCPPGGLCNVTSTSSCTTVVSGTNSSSNTGCGGRDDRNSWNDWSNDRNCWNDWDDNDSWNDRGNDRCGDGGYGGDSNRGGGSCGGSWGGGSRSSCMNN